MRFLWLDINSSYSHSSLAIPSLDAQLDNSLRDQSEWIIISGTISASSSKIILQILKEQPDVIFSTIWLFNSVYVISLLKQLKVLLPNIIIILGGPEFLGDNTQFLTENKHINAVFRGDGEEQFPILVSNLIHSESFIGIKGICLISGNEYFDSGKGVVSNLSKLIIPEKSSFFNFTKPFVQIETSRGCFNSCRFCVSGCKEKVSYINYKSLGERFQYLVDKGIKEVRILDRTFNANTNHAINILSVIKQFAGLLKFHIEVHPAFISDKLKYELESVPPDLIHIEIGIQSLDDDVLTTVGRKGNAQKSLDGLKYLKGLATFEIHADLIAGLPGYTLEKLYDDFTTLVKTGVDEIQVESLKVLPGTEFRNNNLLYKLKFSPIPPYEVLGNDSIRFEELLYAGTLSRASDLWYNDFRWKSVFSLLISRESQFLQDFIIYISMQNLQQISPEKCGLILFDFCCKYLPNYKVYVANSWLLAGFSVNKKPGKLARKWEKGFSGIHFPFTDSDFRYQSYYYIESEHITYWYSFDKLSKNLVNYTSLRKLSSSITKEKSNE